MDFREYIKKYKNYFYIAELLGLLHDIGKSSRQFVEAARNNNDPDEAHTYEELFSEDFTTHIDNFINSILQSIDNPIDNIIQPGKFMEILIKHHSDYISQLAKNNYITDVVFSPGCDGMDSGFDKGNVSRSGTQRDGFFAINFAGKKEDIDIEFIHKQRVELQQKIVDILKSNNNDISITLRQIKNLINQHMKYALAETRIPANDVRLSDHLYSVGALSKTLMVKLLWEYINNTDKTDYLIEWKFFKSTARWQVLLIEWNFEKYIQNIRRISDIVGRKVLIDEFKSSIENLFEKEYPIASLLFKDDSRIAFLFPGFDNQFLKENLRFIFKEVEEKFPVELYGESTLRFLSLKRPSSNLLKLADIFSENKNSSFQTIYIQNFFGYIDSKAREQIKNKGWKQILCDICKSRLAKPVRDETEENICESCKTIREKAKSIQLHHNQIFDMENIGKKLCLVYVKFPVSKWLDGSMLRTIFVRKPDEDKILNIQRNLNKSFEEFKDFIKSNGITDILELIEKLKEKEQKGQNIDGIFGAIKNVIQISESVLKEKFGKDYKYSYYLFSYILEELFIQNLEEISNLSFRDLINRLYHKYPSPSRIRRILQDINTFFEEISCYPRENSIKHRELLRNSDEFAILVPYDKSLEFVEYIYNTYKSHFPLTTGKFPIFVFTAYFKPKFPLYVVLEAIKNLGIVQFGYIYKNGNEIKNKIKFDESYLSKMYVNFEDKEGKIIPYGKIENTKVKFYPSVFDFIIFDSPDRRFETLRYDSNIKRYSQDFEAYIDRILFEDGEFNDLMNILDIFDNLNTATVYKFMEIVYKNYKAWYSGSRKGVSEFVWESFVEDSISNFFDKLQQAQKELIKTYCKNLKIFEIFELWKYIREDKDGK